MLNEKAASSRFMHSWDLGTGKVRIAASDKLASLIDFLSSVTGIPALAGQFGDPAIPTALCMEITHDSQYSLLLLFWAVYIFVPVELSIDLQHIPAHASLGWGSAMALTYKKVKLKTSSALASLCCADHYAVRKLS